MEGLLFQDQIPVSTSVGVALVKSATDHLMIV
jgi:hypothetical protein